MKHIEDTLTKWIYVNVHNNKVKEKQKHSQGNFTRLTREIIQ